MMYCGIYSMVLCFRVSNVSIVVNVVFKHSSMFSTCIPRCQLLWFDLIVKMFRVFHENIQHYIYQDVIYDYLFFYLSDLDLFVKMKNEVE